MSPSYLSKFGVIKKTLDRATRHKQTRRMANRRLKLEALESRRLLVGDVFGKVSDDPNANGVSDPGEDRLPGWTVFVDTNLDGQLSPGEPTQVSDARGEFLFTGLAAGNYRIGEVVQPHYTPTTPSIVNARVRDDRQENVSFLNYHPLIGNLDGTVWNDENGDGVRATDPTTGAFTDLGTAGRAVFLDTNHDGSLTPGELSTTTDANGKYSINGLASGTYLVTQVLPAGWEATTGFSVARNVTVQTDLTTTADYGDFLTQPVTISGTVWNDLDESGVRGADPLTGDFIEPGLAGWTVFVDVNGDELLSAGEPSAVSDELGQYTITGASHGAFTIREVSQTDWIATAPAAGARSLNLLNGQVLAGVDFGNTTAKTVTVQGTVWNDVDGNGLRATDPVSGAFSELGIAGFQVYVDVNGDSLLSPGEPMAVTDAAGLYTITGATRGTLTIREVVQTDWTSTSPATATRSVVLHNGQTVTGVDFGNHQRQESSILGVVYSDANHNGVRDPGEAGLAGITVFLDLNNDGFLDPTEPQTITSADLFFTPAVNESGAYSFTHLASGAYHVREIVPAVQSSTPADQRSHDVTLVTTETHGGVDFGNVFRPNEIHGVEFEDSNGNHVRDAGEPGRGGVTVYIDRNRDNLYEVGELTTVTGLDGSYSFTDLTPGVYIVRAVHSNNYEQTYPGTLGGILWPGGVSNPASGIVSPTSITTSLAEGAAHHETVSLTLPGTGGLTNLVDVFLLFDDTGSFTANSPIVRAAFPQIITALQAALPTVDLGFGVGRFEEYANFAGEFPTGRPFILNQPIVAAAAAGFSTSIQAALNRVAPGFGGDQPETLIEALYQTVTGLGFDGNNNGSVSDSGAAGIATTQVNPGSSGDVPAFSSFTTDPANSVLSPAGQLGGAGFRPGALPIILAATDTGFAYQPKGETSITGLNGVTLPLSALTQTSRATTPFNSGAGIQETITGLNALGAMVIGLGTNPSATADPRQDLEAIANLTGSTNQSTTTIPNGTADPIAPGDPYYFQITSGFGGTVADGVINAIQNAVTHSAVNITLRASDPRVHIINHTGTINGVGAGQTATFDIEFVGDGRPHRFDLQFVREGTSVVLGSIPVVLGTPIPGDGYEYEDLEEGQIADDSNFGTHHLPFAASITGPADSYRDDSVSFTVGARGGSLSPGDTLTYSIDWNGDGSNVQSITTDVSSLTVAHVFSGVGARTINVTAADQNGVVSANATQSVGVSAVRLQPNPQVDGLMDLVWAGTSGADQVRFEQIGPTTIQVVTLKENGSVVNNVETFNGITGQVRATGAAGNDTLDASGLTTTKAMLDGSAGNNTIYGGAAGDTLIGGSNGGEGQQGNNIIVAGNGDNTIYGNDLLARKTSIGGNNLIVGGTGNDVIYGNFGANLVTPNNLNGDGGKGGQNLIIAGFGTDTVYASQIVDGAEGGRGSIVVGGSTTLNQAALLSVLSEWTSTRIVPQKIANITGAGTANRKNGNNFLQPGATVLDDGMVDQLFSDTNGKANWLLYSFSQDFANRTAPKDFWNDTP